jgi:hypothetical protein
MKKWLPLVSGLFLLFVIQLLTIEVGAQSPQVLDILNQSINSNVSSNIEVQSSVDNVTVTKLEVISPSRVSIDLKYSGEGKAPAVKVEAGAINLRSELVQELLNLEDNSSDFNQLLAANSTNSSTLINETLDRLGEILSESNGTKIVAADWKSPRSVSVKIAGNTTISDANTVWVTVHK